MDLVQGSMTVAQYEAEFHRLIHYAPQFMEDEPRKTRKFVEGLKLEIRWSTLSSEVTDYNIAVNQALRVESEIKTLLKREEEKKRSCNPNFPENNQKKRRYGNEIQHDKCWRKNGKCLVCGSDQHRIQECPQKSRPLPAPTAQKRKIPARVFALTENEDDIDPTVVVEGTILLLSKTGKVLFDPGATHSFVSSTFVHHLETPSVKLPYILEISSSMGDKLLSEVLYKDCPLEIDGETYMADLFELPIQGYDVILGMDWLFRYQAQLDCYSKKVKLSNLGNAKFGNHKVEYFPVTPKVAKEAQAIIGGKGFLAYLINKPHDQLKISEIICCSKLSRGFSEEINSLPPQREVESLH
ncbi:uncharacterized protein LOC142550130 [Primulina tabacum]|uniref:uncharacterized protein LOC142550130 n=1 Tax=Primulina tabacum TaxID=48773 RepID=UPI003F5A62D8